MAKLFEPIQIKSVTLRNRITVSPMCQYSAEDGFTNNWHLVHLGARAVGGAGLIIVEASAVAPEGRITAGDVGIWKDEHISNLKNIVNFIHEQGAVAGIQLAHAGRKASSDLPWKGGHQLELSNGGWEVIAPSPDPFREGTRASVELSVDAIKTVIENFKAAATRALTAGFKIVEIHGAHGYLLHEFLSPLSNKRTDAYGGSFENRTRLLLEIIDAVKTVWPADLPVFVRLSSTDWTEGGWTIDDTVKTAQLLKDKGIDLVDCSSGGNVPHAKIPSDPGYQVQFAEKVKQAVDILTGAVGLITTAQQAEDILANKQADLILLARQSLRDPYFPLHAAKELGVDVEWPDQYARAKL